MPKITFASTKIFISNLKTRKHLVSCTTLWLVPNVKTYVIHLLETYVTILCN